MGLVLVHPPSRCPFSPWAREPWLLFPCSPSHWWAGSQGPTLEPCSAQGGKQLQKFRNVEGTSWRGLVVPLQRVVWIGGGGWPFWEPMLRGAEWMEEGLAAGGWTVPCLCPGVPRGPGVD